MNKMFQGSKTKVRLTDALKKLNAVKLERQRLYRALSAIIRAKGEQTLTWEQACAVEEDDRIDIQFDKKSGVYTIKLVEKLNDQLGSGSEAEGVQLRVGDVEGPLPEEVSVAASGDVPEGDQHDQGESKLPRD